MAMLTRNEVYELPEGSVVWAPCRYMVDRIVVSKDRELYVGNDMVDNIGVTFVGHGFWWDDQLDNLYLDPQEAIDAAVVLTVQHINNRIKACDEEILKYKTWREEDVLKLGSIEIRVNDDH